MQVTSSCVTLKFTYPPSENAFHILCNCVFLYVWGDMTHGCPLSKGIGNPFALWKYERNRAGKNPNSQRTWCWMNSEALVTTFILLTKFPPVLIFCLRGSLGIQYPSRCLWKLKLLFWVAYVSKQAILYCLHLDHFSQVLIIWWIFTDKTCCQTYCNMISSSFADKNICYP